MTTRRRVLVTGGNAGIGLAAAEQLAAAGYDVLLGCRDAARGASAVEAIARAVPGASVSVLALDMASQASIRVAAAKVDRLDALVHNAAYFDLRAKGRTVTAEGVETTWATNHLGPALLTELLVPCLRASADARVVAVTSKGLMMFPGLAVDLDDPEFARRRFTVPRAYYPSKLAHLAWMLTQAERFRDGGPRFHGVRVTNVKIDLARYPQPRVAPARDVRGEVCLLHLARGDGARVHLGGHRRGGGGRDERVLGRARAARGGVAMGAGCVQPRGARRAHPAAVGAAVARRRAGRGAGSSSP